MEAAKVVLNVGLLYFLSFRHTASRQEKNLIKSEQPASERLVWTTSAHLQATHARSRCHDGCLMQPTEIWYDRIMHDVRSDTGPHTDKTESRRKNTHSNSM